jgi:phosphoglycolate phosphatase-like HAD superfamily hydrolase
MLTIVFDLDCTLIDTAPDLIDALNFTLAGHALPTVPYAQARSLIGGGAWGMIERALILEGRSAATADGAGPPGAGGPPLCGLHQQARSAVEASP